MPQGIANVEEWQEMLGDGWEDVHRTWLHRLGNLTLVGYDKNSAMSNRPFREKLEHTKGFKYTAVRLNHYVRDQDKWTVDQMEMRGASWPDVRWGCGHFPKPIWGWFKTRTWQSYRRGWPFVIQAV